MHEQSPVLEAKTRERTGTRYAQRLRDSGQLPAVVYGHKQEPVSVALNAHEAISHISKGEKVFELAIEGSEKQFVLLKDLGYDYLGTNIIHADFARVDLNERVDTKAHLKFVGDAPGLRKSGAIMMHPINEIELNVLVTNLPDEIEVDLSELDVDHAIYAKDVKLPVSTMQLLTDPDAIIAQIIIQAAVEETDEATTVEAGAEPEVITEKKPEEESKD